MRISRPSLCPSANLFTLTALCILASAGCRQKPIAAPNVITPGHRELKCETKVNVDANGVDKESIYVCEDPGFNHVTFDVRSGATGINSFTIHFVNGCPFQSCADITNNSPQTVVTQPGMPLTVYKYQVYINGNLVSDPHVVGGGGA
jgi:hypothetical protein